MGDLMKETLFKRAMSRGEYDRARLICGCSTEEFEEVKKAWSEASRASAAASRGGGSGAAKQVAHEARVKVDSEFLSGQGVKVGKSSAIHDKADTLTSFMHPTLGAGVLVHQTFPKNPGAKDNFYAYFGKGGRGKWVGSGDKNAGSAAGAMKDGIAAATSGMIRGSFTPQQTNTWVKQ